MNLLQSPTPTPPPPTTIPNLCATVLLGNAAALSLEWAECMRKIRFFELKSADLRIYFFLLMCDSYLRLAPFRLNAVKHCIFRKSAAVLISFRFKTAKFIQGNVFPIKCNRMLCFLKERRGAYFVRLVLKAAFFPVYTVLIAFVGFITLG